MRSTPIVPAIPSANRILVIKLRAIGDVVLSTVVLKNLRTAFPDAQIDFLTERPSREVVEGSPLIENVIVFNPKSESGIGLILRVRRQRYDLVIDLFGNPRSALITLFSGARHRVGYRFKWRRYCYNHVVEPRGGEVHNTEFNLDALRLLGIPIIDKLPTLPASPDADAFAERFFQNEMSKGGPVIALNPGGGWYTKRWRCHQFAQLGDYLTDKYSAIIVISWGPGERATAEEIRSMMKSAAHLLPDCSLKQLGALFRHCSLLVTNDSGPMHIAAAMGIPIVAIFGPTNPGLQGPVGERHEVVQNLDLLCLGCNYTSCPIGNPCMEELSVQQVAAAVDRLVQRNHLFAHHAQAIA